MDAKTHYTKTVDSNDNIIFFKTFNMRLPLELWCHISYFCEYDSMLNFIKYIMTTMNIDISKEFIKSKEFIRNKEFIKNLLMANINKLKMNKMIYSTYININSINSFRNFITYYNNIHIYSGEASYTLDYKNLTQFYYCNIQYVNLLLKNIDSKNKKKFKDICNRILTKIDMIQDSTYSYENNSFDELLSYVEIVL